MLALFATSLVLLRPEWAVTALLCAMALALAMQQLARARAHDRAEQAQNLLASLQTTARQCQLTGTLNRAGLLHRLIGQSISMPANTTLALVWIDLHRFNHINATLGHKAGDTLLREVAARLKAQLQPADSLARLGSDEFILALHLPTHACPLEAAQQALTALERPFRSGGTGPEQGLDIAWHAGLAVLEDVGSPHETAPIEAALQAADLALRQAKAHAPNRLCRYTAAMQQAHQRRRAIEADLREALHNGDLTVFYQPIIDLESGHIRAFEALVRWFHPSHGEIRPDEFIPLAEETGLIVTLGNWVTLQAAKAAAQWPDHIHLAVNLSPVQIRAAGTSLAIEHALLASGLAPQRLELEITESALLDHAEQTRSFINRLSELGLRFALDDFGTGCSSLVSLDRYRFSKIKIDRSFVAHMAERPACAAIIRAIAGLGQEMGLEIVAEGVETAQQVLAVQQAGCHSGQGWYFSRAVPAYLANALIALESSEQPQPSLPASISATFPANPARLRQRA